LVFEVQVDWETEVEEEKAQVKESSDYEEEEMVREALDKVEAVAEQEVQEVFQDLVDSWEDEDSMVD
jgi:hypothetical protein